MGTVFASQAKPADCSTPGPGVNFRAYDEKSENTDFSSFPAPAPPPPPPTTLGEDNTKTLNPGPMEDLHKKCKDVYPVMFEGGKLMVNKMLSNHFQISHSVNMSSITPSGYRFGATYIGTKQLSPNEAYPILLGDIDPSGNLNANIIHQVTQDFRVKFGSQIQNNKIVAAQLTSDYKGSDFTASLTLGNTDIISESGVIVAHYLQSVTKNFAMGAELAYQYGSVPGGQIPGGQIAVFSAAGRYTGNDYAVSATIGGAGMHFCYYQKASEQLQLGVELETNFRSQESVASVGYQVELPKADLCFKGVVDSNWSIGAVLEKKLQPLPLTFSLSGTMNHSKNQFRLGAGLMIG